MHIGIAEDDPDQADLLVFWLAGGQHTCRVFPSAAGFLDGLKKESFDLLLIDWMLPDGNGGELLVWVRANLGWDVPVIMVTARDDEETVCTALRAGADDYVVKPPQPAALLARIGAVGRRVRQGGLPVLRMGAYEVDIQRHRVTVQGEPITLTQKEFDLTAYLFQSPGKLLSRDHLLNKVWGLNADVDTRTVDTHVSRLRKKLTLDGSLGWRMVPVYGYGYRFDRVEAAA